MRMRKALVACAATLALVGCVGLPDSGPVSAGEVQEGTGLGDVEFIAEGPTPGASQEEIVQGFLQAALSPADDFSIARDYLADGVDWDPLASVALRSGQPELTSTDAATVEATLDVVGSVDEHGTFTTLADDSARRTFVLIEERGEWRIADAPDGLVLSRYSFERLFDAQSLAWFADDRATFVPDVRWFPRSSDDLPAAIVDAALAGPVAWLAPAVFTAADADAVRVGDVVIDDEVAEVTVSFEQVQESSSDELSMLALQLQQSMVRLGITEVIVGVDGIDGYSATSRDAPQASMPAVDARPIVLAGGELAYVGQGAALDADLGIDLAAAEATSVTVRDDDGLAVALASGQVLRLSPGAAPVVLDTGVTVAPSLDRAGWAWWVPDAATQAIVVSDGQREIVLGLPDLQGTIRDVEVSRDGARIAIVTELSGGTAAWVAGIVREDGVPVSVAPPQRMPQVTGSAVDVAWATGTAVAVLTSTQDGGQQLVLLTVGGATQQLATPQDAITQLSGGIGASAVLRARSAVGELLVLRAGQWQASSDVADVQLVATQI
ncbi:Sporulation and spore germination [Agrococcus jejuensis]|uniref:Sporulation and spore germination n=2 Tax=Agrococcus jejuensis TaxID=399736 RepID=A0A1G8B684_9MICO|nr:Sporulation and spore germination [Agrococcus jejuensis]